MWGSQPPFSGLGLLPGSASCRLPQRGLQLRSLSLPPGTAVLTCRSLCVTCCAWDGAEVGENLTEVQPGGWPQTSLAEDRGSCQAWGWAGGGRFLSSLG